jgi:nucleotidyltransferase/DNA polymerase involved in DNA repair
MMNERSQESYFLHADGDSFFVACELSIHPEFRGLPVIVGGDSGIAVAMSTEAKKLGVTRGMPTFQIKKQFPEVVILDHHFDLYRSISRKVYAILLSYVESVEVYSIDECFAVVKPSDIRFYGSLEKLATTIKNEIQSTLGVTYSFGIARTKTLAKTASKLKKPNGLVVLLTEADEHAALKKTHIADVWGLGRKTSPRLIAMGVKTAYDFVIFSSEKLEKYFSEPVVVLQKELSGQVFFTVENNSDPHDQKSIQSTSTFRPASSDAKIIWAELADNAEYACEQARKLRLMTNSLSFFVKTSEFRYHFADTKLSLYTADPGIVLNALERAFQSVLVSGEKIRSTGVILQNLRREEDVPKDLFGMQEKANTKSTVEIVGDAIRKKFGHRAIRRASGIVPRADKNTISAFNTDIFN